MKYKLSVKPIHDGFELILAPIDDDSVGWKKWYKAQECVSEDAMRLGFIKARIDTTDEHDKYALHQRRELYEAVEIDPDRLERFGFRRFERDCVLDVLNVRPF